MEKNIARVIKNNIGKKLKYTNKTYKIYICNISYKNPIY
ncbi:hypothetical protein FORC47_p434 (plasmid) [Bacillus cereus]|nr:hypothetical protein FORC47_p434 [Bacillus cereus]